MSRNASTMAARRPMPSRMAPRRDIRICMESAIARVRMTIGAEAEMGVNGIPSQPAAPMPTVTDNRMTMEVAMVAEKERM